MTEGRRVLALRLGSSIPGFLAADWQLPGVVFEHGALPYGVLRSFWGQLRSCISVLRGRKCK